ncbi:MAG: carboxymuconolactone decarboxylase family protein [Paracoccaceae bacterium]
MSFIETVPEAEATGDVAAMYDRARGNFGYLPNMVCIFSHRPDVMDGWNGLLAAIRGHLDPRRYEIATFAAARAMGSSYCMLAHGKVLLADGLSADTLVSFARTGDAHELTEVESAIAAYAARIATDAGSVTEADIAGLREHGLTDSEIFDIAAAAALRSFFSKLLDALGAQPDAAYRALGQDLTNALTVGRPIET